MISRLALEVKRELQSKGRQGNSQRNQRRLSSASFAQDSASFAVKFNDSLRLKLVFPLAQKQDVNEGMGRDTNHSLKGKRRDSISPMSSFNAFSAFSRTSFE